MIEVGPGGADPRNTVVDEDEEENKWQWEDEDGDYLIWPENWPTWICFLELADQWEMVGAQGFYYQGIPVERIDRVLARARMSAEDEHEAYDALRAMAAVAKPQLNKKLREAAETK